MKLAIAADHAGYMLKEFLKERLVEAGHEVVDLGAHDTQPSDYPIFARKVAEAVIRQRVERALLLCGSGEGAAFAAAKYPGIRAVLCHDSYSARMSMEHNNANVLCMGARVIGPELAWDVARVWLASEFSGEERHCRRLAQVAASERRHPIAELARIGQSIWYDNIRRSLLTSGELRRMVLQGLRGVTSNPTIFEKAISGSSDYEQAIRTLVARGNDDADIFLSLAMDDIQKAAEILHPVYELTEGADGFVSMELPPDLAYDTRGSIETARAYWRYLAAENVMIKVPGTKEGLPAIEELVAEGLNINITLLFSVKVYEQVMEAYLRGLERRVAAGHPVHRIASVASFFVSRVDTAVDKLLEEKIKAETDPARRAELQGLLGKAAVANAKMAYQRFKETFRGPRWEALAAKGARVQRPLWASTSTKNPNYRDVLYVEELVGPDTVNTVPQNTWDALLDHGYITATVEEDLDEARAVLEALARHGIDLDRVTDQLTEEGVKAFADSFNKVIAAVAEKRREIQAGATGQRAELGTYEGAVVERVATLEGEGAAARIWRHDPSLWKSDADHALIIRNRLGWLTVADQMDERVPALRALADEVRREGFTNVVHMGMGGSSLAPEVLRRTFGVAAGYPDLHVLDTTDPATILRLERSLDLTKTLFIVASKSGKTLETLAHYRYFEARLQAAGVKAPGRHFIAITDAGTPLAQLARENAFRAVFENPADIGGRYSALSYFGLVPAALVGVDLPALLDRAERMAQACAAAVPANENLGLVLGAILGELALKGRDKVTLVLPEPLASFGDWVEQLLAESTGKEGKGLIPVAGEPLGPPEVYGADRVFVQLRLAGRVEDAQDRALAALGAAGHPVVTIDLKDALDLGGEFFRWEFATAVAGAVLGVDPFDEPNVQESKDNTDRILAEFLANGALPEPAPDARDASLAVTGQAGDTPRDAFHAFLRAVKPGDYLALTAFVPMDVPHAEALARLRRALRDNLGVATTLGFGPRYLHSSGQLHKGGPGSVVVLQVTAEDAEDARIPGQPYSFGTLKRAQALGDLQSLRDHGRRALRLHFPGDVLAGLAQLAEAVPQRAVA